MTTPNDDQLKSLTERRERLEAVKQDAADDIKELNIEIKGLGFDMPTFNKMIARRKLDRAKVSEQDAMLELYEANVGGA